MKDRRENDPSGFFLSSLNHINTVLKYLFTSSTKTTLNDTLEVVLKNVL